jgi:cell fate (sporulation/competence/biofilm development) regulator YlbF (YheA/YmcA/DUF963 family)
MPVSPQDFDLYSRMTGAPLPSDPLSRMQMAPEVYKFTKDFAKKPNILEKSGNLLKNIGKTIGMGMAGAAASPAFVEPPQTTAENYDQPKVPNQTAVDQINKVTNLGAEVADSNTVAGVLSGSEESRPALDGVPILEGSEPIGLLESQTDRFRRRAITEEADSFLDTDRPGIDPILLAAIKRSKDAEPLEGFKGQLPSYLGDHPDLVGGETPNPSLSINSTAETPITPPTPSTLVSSGTNTSATTNISGAMRDALDSLAKGRADLSPEQRFEMAQKLVSPNEIAGKDVRAFEAIKAGIPEKERSAAAERVKAKTRQKQKELGILTEEDVINAATPPTPATPGVRDRANNFMTNVAEMRTIKPSGAYSDIKVGGMEDKKTGLGKSVGISFTPLNGDTAVTYNYMENPTNPLDVSRRTYQASPEATDQLKSGTGDLGSLSFGKQFNKAVRRMAGGLSAMSNDRFDQDGFLII